MLNTIQKNHAKEAAFEALAALIISSQTGITHIIKCLQVEPNICPTHKGHLPL